MSISIQFEHVSKDFSGHLALDDISCRFEHRGIWGLLGPNGAGKSTFMNILCGIIPMSSGELKWSEDIDIGFAPEKAPLYGTMTVASYLSFCADIREIDQREVDYVIDKLSLNDVCDRYIEALSRGFRQRVNLAQALLNNPSVVVLDEPFIGLDPISVKDVRELILDLGKDHLIIISSHQLRELEDICEKLIFLHKGRLLEVGTQSELSQKLLSQVIIELELSIEVKSLLEQFQQQLHCTILHQELRHGHWYMTLEYDHKDHFYQHLVPFCQQYNISIFSLTTQEGHLDDIFQKMVGV